VSLSLVAACGDDDDGGDTRADTSGTTADASDADAGTDQLAGTDSPADTTSESAGGSGTTAAAGAVESSDAERPGDGADESTGATGTGTAAEGTMTLTVNLAEEAVWEDGTPITVADLECTWRAQLNTPGSIETAGWDQIVAVNEGESAKQAVIEFSSVYGPYRNLFTKIIKAAAVENCDDVSGDFETDMPMSGRAVMIQSWSDGRSTIVPNPNYWGEDTMLADSVVMVPQDSQDAEIAAITAGEVDFIYPQFNEAIGVALDDPNIGITAAAGGDYEALYFQQYDGPFADPVFREAFSKSIDRQAVFDEIYAPIYAAAGGDGELLNCGPIVEGPYCPDDTFQDTFDPGAAEALLNEAGWERNSDGFWAKDGNVPEIRWMINTGSQHRERAQAFLIPRLLEAGFNVVADNGTAEEVFQQRLPTLDYDLTMYTSTAPPGAGYLTPILTCGNIPTAENGFRGQNSQGWCNENATNLLLQADATADPEERTELIQAALRLTETDHVLLPLVNYPKAGAWRTDRVGGPVEAELGNYRAFSNFHRWEDLDGDGQIVIGAEQWPVCLNPVTCANSLWSLWTASVPFLPAIWDSTAEQDYEITNLVTGEPTVEVNQ
jgi:peptide/nickel transport system substrate-binding protein